MPYLTPEKKTAKELLKKDKILVRLNYKRKKKVVQRRTGRG